MGLERDLDGEVGRRPVDAADDRPGAALVDEARQVGDPGLPGALRPGGHEPERLAAVPARRVLLLEGEDGAPPEVAELGVRRVAGPEPAEDDLVDVRLGLLAAGAAEVEGDLGGGLERDGRRPGGRSCERSAESADRLGGGAPGTGATETASLNLASFELGGFAPQPPRAGCGQTKRLALVSTTASASLLMSVVYFVGGGL